MERVGRLKSRLTTTGRGLIDEMTSLTDSGATTGATTGATSYEDIMEIVFNDVITEENRENIQRVYDRKRLQPDQHNKLEMILTMVNYQFNRAKLKRLKDPQVMQMREDCPEYAHWEAAYRERINSKKIEAENKLDNTYPGSSLQTEMHMFGRTQSWQGLITARIEPDDPKKLKDCLEEYNKYVDKRDLLISLKQEKLISGGDLLKKGTYDILSDKINEVHTKLQECIHSQRKHEEDQAQIQLHAYTNLKEDLTEVNEMLQKDVLYGFIEHGWEAKETGAGRMTYCHFGRCQSKYPDHVQQNLGKAQALLKQFGPKGVKYVQDFKRFVYHDLLHGFSIEELHSMQQDLSEIKKRVSKCAIWYDHDKARVVTIMTEYEEGLSAHLKKKIKSLAYTIPFTKSDAQVGEYVDHRDIVTRSSIVDDLKDNLGTLDIDGSLSSVLDQAFGLLPSFGSTLKYELLSANDDTVTETPPAVTAAVEAPVTTESFREKPSNSTDSKFHQVTLKKIDQPIWIHVNRDFADLSDDLISMEHFLDLNAGSKGYITKKEHIKDYISNPKHRLYYKFDNVYFDERSQKFWVMGYEERGIYEISGLKNRKDLENTISAQNVKPLTKKGKFWTTSYGNRLEQNGDDLEYHFKPIKCNEYGLKTGPACETSFLRKVFGVFGGLI